jgi:hypothetical protein
MSGTSSTGALRAAALRYVETFDALDGLMRRPPGAGSDSCTRRRPRTDVVPADRSPAGATATLDVARCDGPFHVADGGDWREQTGRALPPMTDDEFQEWCAEFPDFADAVLTDAERRVLAHRFPDPAPEMFHAGDVLDHAFVAVDHRAELPDEATVAERAAAQGHAGLSFAAIGQLWDCSAPAIQHVYGRALQKLSVQYTLDDHSIRRQTVTATVHHHVCRHCGQPFTAKRSDARYCGARCRQAARRATCHR